MTRRKRTPSEQAEANRAREARKAEVLALRAQGVRVVCDSQWNVVAAQRLDVFQLLATRKRGPKRDQPPALGEAGLTAIRRLEDDVHVAAGAEGSAEVSEYVSGGNSAQRITQRMCDAHGRVRAVVRRLPGKAHGQLALALLAPEHQGNVLTRWRATVERICGWRDEAKQVEAIVTLCAEVAEAYRACDYNAAHHMLTPTRRTA